MATVESTLGSVFASDVEDRFRRWGLDPSAAIKACWDFVQDRYGADEGDDDDEDDDHTTAIRESHSQGYCSYTLCVGSRLIVQFRPAAHPIDMQVAARARAVYGRLAPATRFLGVVQVGTSSAPASGSVTSMEGGVAAEVTRASSDGAAMLFAYCMTRIPGISLAELRSSAPRIASDPALRGDLVYGFAHFVARGWSAAASEDGPAWGRRGERRWLRSRLETLRDSLPPRFRQRVDMVLASLASIEALPWVLTHTDVVPSNIMVLSAVADREKTREDERESGSCRRGDSLSGLLDWAEAECLPFGVGTCGLEELLGRSTPGDGEDAASTPQRRSFYPPPGSRFAFDADAARLRRLFWTELAAAVPRLQEADAADVMVTLERARDLGVLLRHGIAFDEGRLDRVVQEGRDDEEVQRLDLFLFGCGDEGG
ncbi:hypothetical protein VTK73DRAFT_664 [Phialemonium thermophilum]|uniref:Aminoglycoside phosphotransferase domain-containing protein n=1 Tax=Phialemonium thermophilum TaxID=223376 RepID=A0ABR3VUH5_9PEZI